LPKQVKFEIQMPKNAIILCIQIQNNFPQIWALVKPDNPIETRKFEICGTGVPNKIDLDEDIYIGTYQMNIYVFHLFEKK